MIVIEVLYLMYAQTGAAFKLNQNKREGCKFFPHHFGGFIPDC